MESTSLTDGRLLTFLLSTLPSLHSQAGLLILENLNIAQWQCTTVVSAAERDGWMLPSALLHEKNNTFALSA